MIAVEAALGVTNPPTTSIFFVILSPVGAYYSGGFNPTSIMVEDHYVRAVPGGTEKPRQVVTMLVPSRLRLWQKRKGNDQVLWRMAARNAILKKLVR
jgi:branched-chain amino acid aminotransferase